MDTIIQKYDELVFYHWMKRITVNHIIDEFRKNKKYREQIDLREQDELLRNTEDLGAEEYTWKENLETIQRAIDSLPEMSKTVFNLYAIDGYKHEEIGELLNISANTSKVHFFRARTKLQMLLGKEKSYLS